MEVIQPYQCTSTIRKKRPCTAIDHPGHFPGQDSVSKRIKIESDDNDLGIIDTITRRNISSIRALHPPTSTADTSSSSSSATSSFSSSSSSSSSASSSSSESESSTGSESDVGSDLNQASSSSDSSIDDRSDASTSTSSSSSPSPSRSPLLSLQSRIHSLLPALAAANRQLSVERQEGRLNERDIENVSDRGDEDGEKPYIEMNLGLGVLEERGNNNDNEDSSSSSSSDSDSDTAPNSRPGKDVMSRLMGRKKRRVKPKIEFVNEA